MNQQNRYKTELFNGFCIIAIIAFVLFGSWYVMLNTSVGERREIWATTYVVDTMRNDTLQIDAALTNYLNLTDSLKRQLSKIDDDYHDNVDLMINKANGWLAFWIGIIAVALGLLAMWQIFRQIKVEEKIAEHENKFSNKVKEEIDRIDQSLSMYKDTYDKLEKEKERMLCTIRENRIAASMICISISDPLVASSSIYRKMMLKSQLMLIVTNYDEYLKIVKNQEDNDGYEIIPSILTNIKIALVRARPAFSSNDRQVSFHKLIKEIDTAIKDFRKISIFINDKDVELLNDISVKMKDIIMNVGEK